MRTSSAEICGRKDEVTTRFFPQFLTFITLRQFKYVGDPSQMHQGSTGTDRRTLPVATGNYVTGRSAGYENQT